MTRTITAKDGQQFSTRLEKVGKHWVVNLESDSFVARVPLTPFLATLLTAKVKKGMQA